MLSELSHNPTGVTGFIVSPKHTSAMGIRTMLPTDAAARYGPHTLVLRSQKT